jgi:hypothetical protein
MVSPKLKEDGVTFPGIEIFGTLEEAVARTKKVLGDGPQRVVVYPEGGISYPSPTSMGRNQPPRETDES